MSWRKKAALAVASLAGTEPSKLTEGASGGFVSSAPAPLQPTCRGNGDPVRAAEARKARALGYLETHPNVKRACFTDAQTDDAHIVLTVAIREPRVAVEIFMSRARFDAFALMELSLRYLDTSLFIQEH